MSTTEAQDHNTPPARLVELSRSDEYEVRAAVAKNPSTPLPTLLVLAERHPGCFFQNPLIPMLLLEEPNFLHRAPRVIEQLTDEPWLPDWVWGSLSTSNNRFVREYLAGNHHTPASVLNDILPKALPEEEEDTLQYIASNPNAPIAFVEEFAASEAWDRRDSAACNPNAPHEVLARLAKDKEGNIRRSVAENPGTPPSILQILSQDQNEEIKSIVIARDPSTTEDVLRRLSKAESEYIRANVAGNPGCPIDVIESLEHRSYGEVETRINLAKNPNTPLAVLERLFFDGMRALQRAVEQNPKSIWKSTRTQELEEARRQASQRNEA